MMFRKASCLSLFFLQQQGSNVQVKEEVDERDIEREMQLREELARLTEIYLLQMGRGSGGKHTSKGY